MLVWTARGSAISPSPLMPAASVERRVEPEGGVKHPHREIELVFGNQRADLDLARRDREQVDVPLGQHLEHRRRKLRIGPDADPDDADLGHRVVMDQLGIADLAFALLDDRHRLREAGARHGEGQVATSRVFGVAA